MIKKIINWKWIILITLIALVTYAFLSKFVFQKWDALKDSLFSLF